VTELQQIRHGLWQWDAAHPGWVSGARPESPSDWPRDVGCVLFDSPDATVLIDPLLPREDDRFLEHLDRHVERRGLPVAILTTIKWHRRSRDELAQRYGAQTSRARDRLPAGVEAKPIRGAGETMFWLPDHRALVPGDRIMGARSGGLRLCPKSWLEYLPSASRPSLADLAARIRPLLDLPIEMVLVSHGDPVLSGGREALARALDPG
jgi:glyoxylase-like metal-dependent hydrolase (beta-lactamase superfamily II)